jgi:hypothetical protein
MRFANLLAAAIVIGFLYFHQGIKFGHTWSIHDPAMAVLQGKLAGG